MTTKQQVYCHMKLVVLDIDGTLTQTNDADTDCFVSALEECFALTNIETDWSLYTHSTDAGIMEELFHKHFRRSPSHDEIARMQNSFVSQLQLMHDSDEAAFISVAGAADFLACLFANKEWGSVLATGGWAASARFKLQAANLFVPCPIVSSDDGVSREAIIEQAIQTCLGFYRVDGFSRIVSVGDAIWDVNTAKTLRLSFVGIAQGARADRLRSLGASNLLADFTDLDEVFTALDEALEPAGISDSRQLVATARPQC